MRSGKLVIAVGGGPTAVINQFLTGAVLEARLFPQIERIYGARYGVRGIVNEDFVDLSAESRANLEAIAATPSSALGSTRDKPDLAYCRNIFASLKAHGASWFLYIGGNDTADTVRIVSEEAAKEGYDLRSIHIPKTIDNDLMENDHTPGFPSAARFVAQAFMGADLDNRSLPGVYVAVVMGRHAGFLTAASAAARTVEGDGPHLIYLPDASSTKPNSCPRSSRSMTSSGAASSRCPKESVTRTARRSRSSSPRRWRKTRTAMSSCPAPARSPIFYARRSNPSAASSVCAAIRSAISSAPSPAAPRTWIAGRRREVGEFAVKQAIWGTGDGSVVIRRIGDYAFDYALVKLAKVGGKTKVMPDAFIAPSGSDVTAAFQAYLRPLLGSDLPQPARLRGGTIAKVLKR